MTAPARISQAEIERVAKAARNAGWPTCILKIDYAKQLIEAKMCADPDSAPVSTNEWDAELAEG